MFGTFMIAPCGATGKTKQGYFLSRGKVVTAHSGTLRVVPSPKECASCSKTPYQGVRQYALKQERDETNGDGVKPGSTSPMGHGGANVQLGRTRPSLNIFLGSPPKVFSVGLRSVPVCFGVIRELIQHSLGGCGVQRHGRGGRHTNFVKPVYFCARVNYNANRK